MNGAARRRARGNITRNRWMRCCPRKLIGPRGVLWRDWRNAKAICRWRLKLWESILGGSREGLEAYKQLAIHYEHQTREPQRAALLVRKALAELRPPNRSARLSAALLRRYRSDFERRLQRLDRRARPTTTSDESLLDGIKAESRAPD